MYLSVGRPSHRGILNGRPAGCQRRILSWAGSTRLTGMLGKNARSGVDLLNELQDGVTASSGACSLRCSSGISSLASSVRQDFVLQSLNALRVVPIPLL